MNEKSEKPATHVPQEIDDTPDRMGEVHELDFSDRHDERQGRAGDARPEEEVNREFPVERGRMFAASDPISPKALRAPGGARR